LQIAGGERKTPLPDARRSAWVRRAKRKSERAQARQLHQGSDCVAETSEILDLHVEKNAAEHRVVVKTGYCPPATAFPGAAGGNESIHFSPILVGKTDRNDYPKR
jgi:hypothetical protein